MVCAGKHGLCQTLEVSEGLWGARLCQDPYWEIVWYPVIRVCLYPARSLWDLFCSEILWICKSFLASGQHSHPEATEWDVWMQILVRYKRLKQLNQSLGWDRNLWDSILTLAIRLEEQMCLARCDWVHRANSFIKQPGILLKSDSYIYLI